MARKPVRSRNQESSSACNNSCSAACCSNSRAAATSASSSKSIPVAKLLFMIIASCCLTLSHGYNIDLPSYTRHMRENGTMFGFSIAFHKAANSYPSLIVGAPKFNTTYFQPGVVEGGAVFRCGMNDNECGLVHFDSSGNHRNSLGDVIERKSYQWLGATVATSRDNDLVVACAPRYVFHTMSPRKSLRYDPVGTCFMSRNLTQFKEVSPCRTNNFGYHRQGSCQAGFSAATSKQGDRLYIGAPGSWYWQGQIYSVSPDATFPYKPPFYQPFGAGGQTYSYDVTLPENQVYSTSESGSSHDDDSYLGYSMATGDFNGDEVDDIAIGMPRGFGLLGKVVVNQWTMVNLFNFTGSQIGEYFGYSLVAGDVDGDGLDDLIIGAPMYTEQGNMDRKYDVGRVYIRLQISREDPVRWTRELVREGTRSRGRFGLSLAYLGDINRDGYGDFAVGAPYDGPHGFGVVYIFHGSKDGPLAKPSQIINSEDLVEVYPYPRTFGFSLAGGVDIDGNTYPDLAVGAYESSQVYIFRSRPVAAVDASTTFLKQSKLIDIEDKRCRTIRDGKMVACTDLRTCWSYTGHQLPQSLEFNVSWILDAKKQKSPRMFFLNHEGKNVRQTTIRLYYGQTYCQNETVYVIDNIQDKLTPLEVETRYNLYSSRGLVPAVVSRRRRDVLEPVIDENREIIQRDALNIQKNCGPDNICIPDLRLQIKTVNEYLLGSGLPLPIEVMITNRNEDAFEAAYYMTIPKDVEYRIAQTIGDNNDTTVTCSAPTAENNYTIKCDLGNPFPANQMVNFKVILMPTTKVGMSSSYIFHSVANSTNEELAGTRIDNEITKEIPIMVDTSLEIEGVSLPNFQLYKASDYRTVENSTHENHLGPQVVHSYNIRNKGPSIVEEAVIMIYYPHKTNSGDLLMYVLNQPETHGNIVCDPHESVNVLNLEWDPALKRHSYLEQIGAIVTTQSEGKSVSTSGGSSSGSSSSSSNSQSGVIHIEKANDGRAVVGSTTYIHGKYKPTEEETRRYEKEEEQDVTGDASLVHSDRAQKAAEAEAAAEAARANAASSWTSSSSWNSTSGRRPSSIVVTMRNSTTYYDPSGTPHKVESSTEYVQNLERGPGYYNQRLQNGAANYQQSSANYRGGNLGGQTDEGITSSQLQLHQQQQQQQAPPTQITSSRGRDSIQMAGAPMTHHSSNSNQRQSQHGIYNDGGNADFHKVVQDSGRGGSGNFRFGTLDLAPVGRQNVDSELQQNRFDYGGNVDNGLGGGVGSNTGSGNSRSYSKSFSTSGNPQAGVQTQTYYQSNSKPYYGMEDEDFYDESNNHAQHQQQQQTQRQRRQRRYKRDEKSQSLPVGEPHTQIDLKSLCKAAECKKIRCVAKNLEKDDDVWVSLRMRIVAKTMEKLAGNVPLNVSTMAVSQVVRLPYIGEPKNPIIKTHEIFYQAQPEPTPVPDVVPLWVVVLAACAGALILLLLVLLLWKCGFFKRNRPTNHPERQPLRNGYHGDEHL